MSVGSAKSGGGGGSSPETGPCAVCVSGFATNVVTVTISGLTDDNCDECDSINGEYELDRFPVDGVPWCLWKLEVEGEFCTFDSYEVSFFVGYSGVSPGNFLFLEVRASPPIPGSNNYHILGQWRLPISNPYDCLDMDEMLPETGWLDFLKYGCRFDESTARVRAGAHAGGGSGSGSGP